MDADRFDVLVAALRDALTTAPSRRVALRVIGGLGLAGNEGAQSLSASGEEVLADLSRIAASDLDTGDGDEAEADLSEVFEYVRVGVLLLQAELTAVTPGTTRH